MILMIMILLCVCNSINIIINIIIINDDISIVNDINDIKKWY